MKDQNKIAELKEKQLKTKNERLKAAIGAKINVLKAGKTVIK